jgi:putative membrane protein
VAVGLEPIAGGPAARHHLAPAGTPIGHPSGEALMALLADIVVALVALLHVYILVLEMFLWDKPAGLRAFGQTPEAAATSKVLAANQGLYNGFLAAGLFWGLSLGAAGSGVKIFFLLCVLVAGLYGAATANRKILYVQALPAAIGLALLWLAGR